MTSLNQQELDDIEAMISRTERALADLVKRRDELRKELDHESVHAD